MPNETEVIRKYCRIAKWDSMTGLGAGNAGFYLAEISNAAEAVERISAFCSAGLKIQMIGAGMNFIGTDELLSGIVFLKLNRDGDFGRLQLLDETHIFAGAACSPGEVIRFALEHGLGGAAGLSGIPGTLGGALAMNAGARGVCFADLVKEVRMISLSADDLREFALPPDGLGFGYRKSPFLRDNMLVTGAVLEFRKVDPEAEQELIREEQERRKLSPKGRSAGSIFQNVPEGPAGKLLEEAGCKGLECGAFLVSPEHANWIVRKPDAAVGNCADFVRLANMMKQRVKSARNIDLIPEVRFAEMSENVKMGKKPLSVLVLKGGCSSEREVSLESGHAIADALREKGYAVSEYDIRELALTPEMKQADIVWPVLHGGFGEDGRIQKLLEDADIPFVGSGSKACALIMDKVESKKLMDAHGIPNAKYAVLTPDRCALPEGLKFPLVVKPVAEGSTYGLSVVDSPGEWDKAIDLVFRYGKEALAEEFFSGVEVTLGMIAGKALPMIEIRYTTKVYDYDAKYLHKTCETQYLCHAPAVPEAIQEKLREASLLFFKVSGARDILRTDLIVNVRTGDFIMLEGNAIPGCTANSLVPKAAKAIGMSFPDMCALLLEDAAARFSL
ncbi:MAG: D-alanine--D-alanine ligase [Lentisphaeria bacterium]|nr:D-alanine--D-alanine ligase [Lentisphaeria bacterium]